MQAKLASLANEDQFSANRHALLFKPGAYNVQAPVGYYEAVVALEKCQARLLSMDF